uniref:Uncharacterized protein AlNc14C37G3282 n=1 Tax=Albugo laibachii Nc14 TaxID=890382 RepID=F0W912_9STRA|nr:conserved hypothetical protein [Albugo laibachii Nc14]|eukprot:CCA17623.1 conserved hypothetical protein [Albugo laibachii Nc14]
MLVHGKNKYRSVLPIEPDSHFPFCLRYFMTKKECEPEEGNPLSCTALCPFNYPVSCGPYCLPQNSDCNYFIFSRIGAVTGAALQGVSSGFFFFQLLERIRPSLKCIYYTYDLIGYTISTYNSFVGTIDTEMEYAPFKKQLIASLCTPIFVIRVEHLMKACTGHNINEYWPLEMDGEVLAQNKLMLYRQIVLRILEAKEESLATFKRPNALLMRRSTFSFSRSTTFNARTRAASAREKKTRRAMEEIMDFLRAFNLDQVLRGLTKEERTLVERHVRLLDRLPSEILEVTKELEAAYTRIAKQPYKQNERDGIREIKLILRKLRTTNDPLLGKEQEALDAIAVAIHAEAYANSLSWIDKAKLFYKHRGGTVKTLFKNVFYVAVLDAIPLLETSGLAKIARTIISVKCPELKDTKTLVQLTHQLAKKFVVVAKTTAFDHADAKWSPYFENGNITIKFVNEDDADITINIHSGGTPYTKIPIQAGITREWTDYLHILQDRTLYIDRWRRYCRGISLSTGGSLRFWVPHVLEEGKGQLTMTVYIVRPN